MGLALGALGTSTGIYHACPYIHDQCPAEGDKTLFADREIIGIFFGTRSSIDPHYFLIPVFTNIMIRIIYLTSQI